MNSIIKSPYDKREYASMRLNNGLESLFISDETIDTAHVAIIVGAGFMMDGEVNGLAHFLEHMLFMGTEKYPAVGEYMNYINSHGGSTNAFTTSCNTSYFFSVDSNYLSNASDRMAQFFISPKFDPTTISKEINAVNSEFQEMKTNYLFLSIQMMKQLVDETHPLHQFDVGSKETLNIPNIRDKLIEFYHKYYVANNMKLIIIDKRPIDEIYKIAQIYADIPNKSIIVPIFRQPFVKQQILKFIKPNGNGYNSNDIWLYWAIPINKTIESISMMKYIMYLIGKDTTSSLSSVLRQYSLISSLGFYTIYNLKEYHLISMTLNVTIYGLKHIDTIIQIIQQYMNDLLNNPPKIDSQHILMYNKCNSLHHKFMEKKESSEMLDDILTHVCEYCLDLPLALKYETLPSYYNDMIYKSILNELQVSKVNIVVASSIFETSLFDTQELYGIKYRIESNMYLNNNTFKMSNLIKDVFSFNEEFIPQQLMVYTNKESYKFPIKISCETPDSKITKDFWYMHKNSQTPKASVIIELTCPDTYKTIKTYIATNIFLCHIIRCIDNELSDSKLIGTFYELSLHRDKLQIMLYGFNDTLAYYCQKIMNYLQLDEIKYKEYIIAVNTYGYRLENKRQRRIGERLHNIISKGIFENTYLDEELLAILGSIKHNDLQGITLSKCCHIKCFVNGNIPKQIAMKIYETLDMSKIIKQQDNNCSDEWRLKPINENISSINDIGQITNSQTNNLCSVIVCIGQVMKNSIEYDKCSALNLLFDNIMHTRFFELLRSQQQLGYTVKCIPCEFGKSNVLIASTFNILSQKYSHKYLLEKINLFFIDMYNEINRMTLNEFNMRITSCIIVQNERPNNILDESNDLFTQISAESYKFDYRDRIINELKNINLDLLKDEYIRCFINENRKRIVIQGR